MVKKGGGASHIDAISLNGLSPVDSSISKKKTSAKDNDVADMKGSASFIFDARAGTNNLVITARIEPTKISTTPFLFPKSNLFKKIDSKSEFYSYDPHGEAAKTPLFAEYIPVGSGHPQGKTYCDVSSDGRYLHVCVDFTPDNTCDGDKDYARLYLKGADGAIRTFHLSEKNTKHGAIRFTPTSRAAYEHKVYDFRVPLKELALNSITGEKIGIAVEAYGTATPVESKSSPTMAFDCNHNRFLVVYKYFEANSSFSVKARLLNHDAAPYGSEITLINTSAGELAFPSVSFDFINNRFLVLWGAYDGFGRRDIFARFVTAGGELQGDAFTLCDEDFDKMNPVAVFNHAADQYLLAWSEYNGSNYDVRARLVSAQGSAGEVFTIGDGDGDQLYPQIAYNPRDNNYFTAWKDWDTSNIDGRLVTSAGAVSGDVLSLVDLVEPVFSPSLAHDTANNRYGISYMSVDRIRAATFSSTGGEIVGDTLIHDPAEAHFAGDPCMVYNSHDGVFWYSFTDFIGSDFTTMCRQSGPGLAGLSSTQTIQSDATGYNYYAPISRYNNLMNNHATVSFMSNNVAATDYCFTVTGDPSGNGAVVFDGGRGVSPQSGSAGETFTFTATYFGTALPGSAQVWIDANAANLASAPWLPGVSGAIATGAFMTAVMLVLAGMAAFFLRGFRSPAFALPLIIAAMVMAYGCSGGSSGGNVDRFSMTEVDPADTDCIDGKVYQVQVPLASAGTYWYRFVFTSSSGEAVTQGTGPVAQSLEVN